MLDCPEGGHKFKRDTTSQTAEGTTEETTVETTPKRLIDKGLGSKYQPGEKEIGKQN